MNPAGLQRPVSGDHAVKGWWNARSGRGEGNRDPALPTREGCIPYLRELVALPTTALKLQVADCIVLDFTLDNILPPILPLEVASFHLCLVNASTSGRGTVR